MDPVEFTDEERAFLPPHDYVVLAKDQPQYRPLPSVLLHGSDGRRISRWTLTPEERYRIASGEDLYIEQLTFLDERGRPNRPQPLLPTVGLRDFCPRDM